MGGLKHLLSGTRTFGTNSCFNRTRNPYDVCVYNKVGENGKQITIVVHVGDLLATSVSRLHIDAVGTYLKSVYPETKTSFGQVLSRLRRHGLRFH